MGNRVWCRCNVLLCLTNRLRSNIRGGWGLRTHWSGLWLWRRGCWNRDPFRLLLILIVVAKATTRKVDWTFESLPMGRYITLTIAVRQTITKAFSVRSDETLSLEIIIDRTLVQRMSWVHVWIQLLAFVHRSKVRLIETSRSGSQDQAW